MMADHNHNLFSLVRSCRYALDSFQATATIPITTCPLPDLNFNPSPNASYKCHPDFYPLNDLINPQKFSYVGIEALQKGFDLYKHPTTATTTTIPPIPAFGGLIQNEPINPILSSKKQSNLLSLEMPRQQQQVSTSSSGSFDEIDENLVELTPAPLLVQEILKELQVSLQMPPHLQQQQKFSMGMQCPQHNQKFSFVGVEAIQKELNLYQQPTNTTTTPIPDFPTLGGLIQNQPPNHIFRPQQQQSNFLSVEMPLHHQQMAAPSSSSFDEIDENLVELSPTLVVKENPHNMQVPLQMPGYLQQQQLTALPFQMDKNLQQMIISDSFQMLGQIPQYNQQMASLTAFQIKQRHQQPDLQWQNFEFALKQQKLTSLPTFQVRPKNLPQMMQAPLQMLERQNQQMASSAAFQTQEQHQQHQHQRTNIEARSSSSYIRRTNSVPFPSSKREWRKMMQLEMTSEQLLADSTWRKYGEKTIKNSNHRRSYYRCTAATGCRARRQVEQSPTDKDKFLVYYMGKHNHPNPVRRSHPSRPRGRASKFTRSSPNGNSSAQLEPPSQSSSLASASSFSQNGPPRETEIAPNDSNNGEEMSIALRKVEEELLEGDNFNDENNLFSNFQVRDDMLRKWQEAL